MTLGLREANQQFAKLVRAVRAGKEVTLTDRGRPVAVIKPIAQAVDEEALFRRLEEEGLIVRPTRPGPMPRSRWRPLSVPANAVAESLDWTRDESH